MAMPGIDGFDIAETIGRLGVGATVAQVEAEGTSLAPLVLVAVAFAACMVPAWRAAAIDPAEALRAE